MKYAMARAGIWLALAVAFATVTALAQTTQPKDQPMGMRDGGQATMSGGGAPMDGMGQGGGTMSGMGGADGAAGGQQQVQFSCCPPSAVSMMMSGPSRWLAMLVVGLLVASVIILLLSLSVFFVRRSRVGISARM